MSLYILDKYSHTPKCRVASRNTASEINCGPKKLKRYSEGIKIKLR
jgi:hypothetical protein